MAGRACPVAYPEPESRGSEFAFAQCELWTPSVITDRNEQMIDKALSIDADMVFLDLEDAVALDQRHRRQERQQPIALRLMLSRLAQVVG